MSNHKGILTHIVFGMQKCGIYIPKEPKIYHEIINKYITLCDDFIMFNHIDKLDTLQKAGCLLSAINQVKLVEDNEVNADIAITAALHMCEQPADMEKANIEEAFIKHQKHYNNVKKILIDTLTNSYLSPFSCYLNLKSIYESVLEENNKQKRQNLELKS